MPAYLAKTLLILFSLTSLVLSAGAYQPDGRLLVWTAPVNEPGQQTAGEPGELAYLNNDGTFKRVIPVPEGANRIELCGEQPISPDGRQVALFMGNQDSPRGGGLYLMKDGDTPQEVDSIQALGCWGGNGRFMFSPDSRRFAYISYPPDARTSASFYAAGDLKIRRADDYSEAAVFATGRIVTFDLTNAAAAFVSFFTDNRGRAEEAVLSQWDGDNERELLSIPAGGNCQFSSAYLKMTPDAYWLILGERCQETAWQLFRVEPDGSNALLALRTNPVGALSKITAINNLIFSRDGGSLFYTLPDGLRNNTVGLYRAALNDLPSPQQVIEKFVEMPNFSGSRLAFPQFSPDGRWLALTVNTPQDDSSLQLIDLDNPSAAPLNFAVGERGDILQYMTFMPDSQSLIYLAGKEGLNDNSLFRLDIASGQSSRLSRGTFSNWAILSPDGEQVAILEWQDSERTNAPNFLNLVLVNTDDGAREVVYQGEQVDTDNRAAYSFALPLYWFGD